MITNSRISWGNQLGAQLTTIAALTYICEENGQELVLWGELLNYRRGYQFFDVFDIDDIKLISRSGKLKYKIIEHYCSSYKRITSWERQMNRIYKSTFYKYVDRLFYEYIRRSYRDFDLIKKSGGGGHTREELLQLSPNHNYDIIDGFGIYQDWKKYEEKIVKRLRFKQDIVSAGEKIYSEIITKNQYRVAVHFRRTDYLIMSSLNLDEKYYEQAMNKFDNSVTSYLIFSDDIGSIKDLKLFNGKDVVFIASPSAGIDMYLMARCDGNIIANSTFSFWGALLNSGDKKVICPHDFVGSDSVENSYINGNWYPESWIAL